MDTLDPVIPYPRPLGEKKNKSLVIAGIFKN